jgi:hypothetical protein
MGALAARAGTGKTVCALVAYSAAYTLFPTAAAFTGSRGPEPSGTLGASNLSVVCTWKFRLSLLERSVCVSCS